MIQNFTMLAFIASGAAAVISPAFGYALGLSRVRSRSPEMIEYYKAQQRATLISFYRIVAIASVVELAGVWLLNVVPSFAADIAIVMTVMMPAGIVLITLVPVGLSIGVALTVASYESMPGCCANCDYDLRGNPEARCPECGHPEAIAHTARQA